ncbi:MAG TPA: Crp/Fnr family transcriptional regulator [Xanthobacteraceae bacterium]|jgi:CRP/FNR family transcriptional regulator, cyclic AMP receptor protein
MTTTRTKTETLAGFPLFRSLSAAAIARLDTLCTWRRATGGQWVLDYQDASNDVFFVVAGAVHVMIQSGGRDVLFREIRTGEYFGELAAIDRQPRSSGIVAVVDVTLGRMPAAAFLAAVNEHADVCNQVLALLAGQIRSLSNRVHEFTTLDVQHRIMAELLRLSRPEPNRPGRAIVSPPPIHAEIAARVSTRREGVVRELNALERAGLIERRRGAIVLTDVGRMRRLVDEALEDA